MKTNLFSLVGLVVLGSKSASAATVLFTAGLDTDQQANTSTPTTPYDAAASGTQNNAGIPNGTVSTFSDTYYFADATTGLAYSWDLTYSSTGGNLGASNGNLGVGDVLLNAGETLTLTLSNLVVDSSGYISGSVGGLAGPVNLVNTGLGFERIAGQFRGGATDISVAQDGGTAAPIGGATLNAATGIASTDLGDTGVSYTFSNPVNGEYRLNSIA